MKVANFQNSGQNSGQVALSAVKSGPAVLPNLAPKTWVAKTRVRLHFHTSYDALGRVTSTSQDSEWGALTTVIGYSGFQTSTRNPNGHTTTVSFQAYDSPCGKPGSRKAGVRSLCARRSLGAWEGRSGRPAGNCAWSSAGANPARQRLVSSR